MKLFSLDGPFQKYGTMVFDLLMLDLYWFFITAFSFGLLFGPANVALFEAVNKSVLHSEGTPTKVFFATFKSKFLTSFLGNLIGLFALISCGVAAYWSLNNIMPSWMFPLYLALSIYIFMIFPYFIALINLTDFKLIKIIKYAILLAIKHLPITLLNLIIMAISMVIIILSNYTFSFLIGAPMMLVFSYLVKDRNLSKYDFSQFQ